MRTVPSVLRNTQVYMCARSALSGVFLAIQHDMIKYNNTVNHTDSPLLIAHDTYCSTPCPVRSWVTVPALHGDSAVRQRLGS